MTVDENGTVTTVGEGEAIITVSMAETDNCSAAASKTITVQVIAPVLECPASYYGFQKRANTDGTTDLRLIGIINTLEAEEAGFVYSVSDMVPVIGMDGCNALSTKKVYSSIKVDNEAKTAAQLGGEGAYIIVEELVKKWKDAKEKAIRKNLMLDAERNEILSFMEREGIWYLTLKGILLKEMYPSM